MKEDNNNRKKSKRKSSNKRVSTNYRRYTVFSTIYWFTSRETKE